MMDTLFSGINEIYCTENWQNENELYVILKFEEFMNFKHRGEIKNNEWMNSQGGK